MYSFRELEPTRNVWSQIENTYDTTIYKTQAWMGYIALQACKPFVVEVSEDGNRIGYFVGEKIKKGLTIIASPFEGIGTGHQGLAMFVHVTAQKRIEIYEELVKWIYKEHISWYVQIEDWELTMDDIPENAKFYHEPHRVKYVDLTQSEEVMYENLHKDCKYSIRKTCWRN